MAYAQYLPLSAIPYSYSMSASLSICLPARPALRCLCNVHLRFISVRPCRAYPPDMASDFRFALQRTRNQLSLRLTACPTYPPVSLSCCLSVYPSTFYLFFSLSISQRAWPEYLNCGILVAFEVKVFAFDFGYKVNLPHSVTCL